VNDFMLQGKEGNQHEATRGGLQVTCQVTGGTIHGEEKERGKGLVPATPPFMPLGRDFSKAIKGEGGKPDNGYHGANAPYMKSYFSGKGGGMVQ